jgi:O-antigen ligase
MKALTAEGLMARASEAGICVLLCLAPLLSRSSVWDIGGVLLLGLALVFWGGLQRRTTRPQTTDHKTRTSGQWSVVSGQWSFCLERTLIACLFAWLTASAVVSPDAWKGLGHVALLGGCALCAALSRGAMAPGRGRRLTWAAVWGGAWVSAVGIAEYYGVWAPAQAYPGRVVAAFANPNDLGVYLCALLPAGALLLLSDLRGSRKAAALAGTVLSYTCLLMSGSRGAWWAGLCAGGVAVAGGWRMGLERALWRNRGWALALFVSLAGVTVLYSAPSPLRRPTAISIPDRFVSSGEIAQGIARPEAAVSSTSVGHRYLIWSVARSMMAGHPVLGVGPGFFDEVYPALRDRLLREMRVFDQLDAEKRGEDVLHAHNDYLEMGAEAGAPGLLLFGVLIGIWVARAWRQARRAEGEKDRLARLGLLASVAAVLVDALVSYPLHIPAVAVLFWSFLGMGMGREQ